MSSSLERCPKTDLRVEECDHCRRQRTRDDATYVITVSLRQRGTDEPRTIHDPDCWHALNDTEPLEVDWTNAEMAPLRPDGRIFITPDHVIVQDGIHREWEGTGRLRRRSVRRADLQIGSHGTVVFEGHSHKRCQRCAPDIW